MKRIPYSLNENEKEKLYGEELNFYIDSTSNNKESLDNSDKSSENKNNINNYDFIPMNKNKNSNNKIINIKNNSKYNYIKSLEQKILQQEKQISQIINYKNLCEETIKEMNPLIKLPLRNDINYNNQNYINKKNKKISKKLNLSFNQNHINSKTKNKGNIHSKYNRANSELDIDNLSDSETDKYDKLYLKYIKIINDFKNLSNNSVSTNEYTRLKTQFNELKNKNNNLIKQIQNSKKTLNNEENEIIKNLKEQVKTFREELVLSQAMVNSLRSELEQYNKNNPNYYLNFNDIESSDKRNYIPNNNNSNNNLLKEENENLKISLKNNNILLSKVLEENNRLRQNNFGNQSPNINIGKDNIDEDISNLKNNLIQYKNKFSYFNDYINNIKNKIELIYDDIKNLINKCESLEKIKILTEDFMIKLKEIKNDFQKIKNIDSFNLDSINDECLKIYMNLVKIFLEELQKNRPILINNDYQNNTFDKTKKYLVEILEIFKIIINENVIKQLISDALNIINNLENLDKLRKNNSLNGNNNIDINEKIVQQEKELEYIKTLLLNHKKDGKNKNVTYIMNYNIPANYNNKNKNGYYFQYE